MASRCSCRSPAGPRALIWRQFDVGQRRNTCFASTLLPHRAWRQFLSLPTPGDPGHLGTLRAGGMSSDDRAPLDEGCGPVPAAVRCPLLPFTFPFLWRSRVSLFGVSCHFVHGTCFFGDRASFPTTLAIEVLCVFFPRCPCQRSV